MNKTVNLLVASIVAIAANSAIAGPGSWYIGAGAGMSSYQDWLSQEDITTIKNEFQTGLGYVQFNGAESSDSEDRASAFKLFGGFAFNENIAVELSYIDMGEVDAKSSSSGTFFDIVDNPVDGDLFATARASVDAFTLDASLSYPVASFAALFVKAGVYAADAELELSAGGSASAGTVNDSSTKSSSGLHFGIGANFKVTDAIGLRAEWERLDNVEVDRLDNVGAGDGESDVDLVSASLIYSF